MALSKNSQFWRFKWHIVIVYGVLLILFLAAVLTKVFQTPQSSTLPQLLWFLLALVFLSTAVLILAKISRMHDTIAQSSARLERVINMLERNRTALNQLNQNVKLSEKAKTIVFHDNDKYTIQEAVFEKLHQQDFDTTYSMIDEIAKIDGFKDLADQLTQEVERYKKTAKKQLIDDAVAHIDELLDKYDWVTAHNEIENLVKEHPDSERILSLQQKLLDKKHERKKILLNAWDDSVKRQATDRSLEILKDLDLYLTPKEALALQEQASSVFRNKLHSLGVQFSLAVSGQKWQEAFQTGRQIIQDFPNSKISDEIRQKMELLQQKITPQ